ncbi:MFS transporter permease [Nocardioides sp. Soil796]|nr:MFS transporter permease [Nocardioides sp. Soil796]
MLLVFFLFLNYADKAVLAFGGKEIQHELGMSPAQFGLVQSSFFWLFAVGAVALGSLSTRIGLRWLLGGLMVIWVFTMAPLLGTTSFLVLLLTRIMLGFAEGPAYGLATHAVHGWFPAEKRALPAGLVTAGASIGPLVCAPVLTWIIVTWNWHVAFGVLMVAGLVWAALWLVLARNVPADHCVTDEAPEQEVLADVVPAAEPDVSYWTLLKTGTVAGIAALLFLGYWSTALKIAWLPVYLSDGLDYGTLTAGRLVMIPYAVAAFGAIASGWLSNRLVSKGVSLKVARGYLAGSLVFLAGASMFGLTLVGPGILQMALITLAFSGNVASYAVAFTAVADVVPALKRGPILTGLVGFSSLAGIIAPLVMGFSVSAGGGGASGYSFGFALTGILMAVGSVVATLFVDPTRDALKIESLAKESL